MIWGVKRCYLPEWPNLSFEIPKTDWKSNIVKVDLASLLLKEHEDAEKGFSSLDGLTDAEVAVSREEHGVNEVKAHQEPEWKKILKRYTDWIVIMMVRVCHLHSFGDIILNRRPA
jgi:hypothetical protein